MLVTTQPHTINPDAQVYKSIRVLKETLLDQRVLPTFYNHGDTIEVYRFGEDEPHGRFVIGPRFGLKWELFG